MRGIDVRVRGTDLNHIETGGDKSTNQNSQPGVSIPSSFVTLIVGLLPEFKPPFSIFTSEMELEEELLSWILPILWNKCTLYVINLEDQFIWVACCSNILVVFNPIFQLKSVLLVNFSCLFNFFRGEKKSLLFIRFISRICLFRPGSYLELFFKFPYPKWPMYENTWKFFCLLFLF